MKKLIAGITTTALIASLSAPAFAANFDDVKGTSSEKAAGMLKALQIVNGDVDGKFNPNNTITRAEFAKIAVKVAGLGAAADAYGMNANTGFSDVPAGHWAAGYVAVAQSAGLVKGYGDGTFGANDNVQYEDVVTVIDRILGYTDNVQGGYPSGYVVKGAALGLTTNTAFQYGKAATRGDVAIIAQAALSQNPVTYSKDSNSFTVDLTKTLLSDKFSNSTVKAVFNETFNSAGTSLKDKQVKIGNIVYTVNDATIVVGGSLDSLVGRTVTVVADNSTNVLSYVADSTIATNVIAGGLFVPTGGQAVNVSSSVYTVKVGGTNYSLDSGVEYFYNGGAVLFSDFQANAKSDDSATVVLNKNGNAQFVGVKHYDTPFIAANLYGKTDVSKAKIDSYSVEDNTVFTRDGKAATFADIKAGDVVYVVKSKDGVITGVDAFSTTKVGTLSTYNTKSTGAVSSITVDGVAYSVDADTFTLSASDVAGLLGKSVTVTLDKDGYAATVKATDSTAAATTMLLAKKSASQGVYVVDPTTNETSLYTKLTFVKSDGTTKDYYVAKDSTTGNDKVTYATLTEGNVYAVTTDSKGFINGAAWNVAYIQPGKTIQTDGVDATSRKITVNGASYYVASDAVIFDDSAAGATYTKVTASSFDKLKDSQVVTLYLDEKNAGTAKSVVITSGGTSLKAARTAGAFVKRFTSYDADNTASYFVALNVNGTTTNLQLDDLTAYNGVASSGVVAGDAVSFTDAGNGKYDTTVPATASAYVYKDSTITNGFRSDNVDSFKQYVYDANTKVYIVNFEKGQAWNSATRSAATVGTISDFSKYIQATGTSSSDLHFEFTKTSTVIGSSTLIDAVVIYVAK